MPIPPVPLTGVLLAGGRSRRMRADKALLEVGGEPLALRGVRVLAEVCAPILAASGDGRRLADILRQATVDVEEIADAVAGAGPLGGILAGLEAAPTDLVAVLAVDHLSASSDVLRRLADAWAAEAAVIPVVGGRPQPLHAVWARAAAPALRAFLDGGGRTVMAAADRLGARLVGAEVWGPADPAGVFARNVNRPGELPLDP